MNLFRAQQFNEGDRVIRKDSNDRALFFVIEGVLFGLDEAFPSSRNKFLKGAILGVD